MTRYYEYSLVITNDYLGLTKTVKGATDAEVRFKALEQLRRWEKQEDRDRDRQKLLDLKERAAFETEQSHLLIESYRQLLHSTLSVDDTIDWESLKDHSRFKSFGFNEPKPSLEQLATEMKVVLKEGLITRLSGLGRVRHKERVANVEKRLNEELASRHSRLEAAREAHESAKAEFDRAQQDRNASVDKLRQDYELGHGEAIEKYVYMVLERSQYPEGLERNYEVAYDPIGETLIVAYELPQKQGVPNIVSHRYVASRKSIDQIEMKPKEFDAFYEDIIYQVCLRTIHEVFESVQLPTLKSVVFNGWISGIDAKTGNDFRSCIISCQASRSEFEMLNLERVSPKECFRHLKGLAAGPLAELAPVRPIMDLQRDDKRFVASDDVVSKLDSATNLAAIDWEAFEHLVRQLFEQIFAKGGGEVRVTQASRDGGVDAIAFDPDPIRGGKFVIQAKRYNNVVPVSAVRDLYGTMINEGATKGILVTTSYYGNDSREFAKDKPITLIDGSNLVFLLAEHGHDYTIELRSQEWARDRF